MNTKPSPSNGIAAGKLVAVVSSLINPAASVLGTLFFEGLAQHANRKTELLLQRIEGRLTTLEKTGILEINALIREESFLDLLLTAARAAQHTHRKEKLLRIQNAVVFCALKKPSPEESDTIFHLIDQLSEEHFIILKVLRDNIAAFDDIKNFSDIYTVFCMHYTSMPMDTFGHFFYDLKFRRIIRVSPKIYDESGLAANTHFVMQEEIPGALIEVSAVGLHLLEVTEHGP